MTNYYLPVSFLLMSNPSAPEPTKEKATPELGAPPLAESFSQRQKAIFLIIGLIVVVSVGYKLFSRNSIKLLKPTNNINLKAEELEFSWECDQSDISFVIEVFDEGELVMRQITTERSYRPDLNQKLAFQANRVYRWQVIANPDLPQKYSFKPQTSYFRITQAVIVPTPPPEPAPEEVKTPSPSPLPLPLPSPGRKPRDF